MQGTTRRGGGGGRARYVCDPGSNSRLAETDERRVKTMNGNENKIAAATAVHLIALSSLRAPAGTIVQLVCGFRTSYASHAGRSLESKKACTDG